MTAQPLRALVASIAALVLVSGCGHTSPQVFGADQVQEALTRSGLVTTFLMDCRKLPVDCPLTLMVGPGANAVIGDFREKVRTPYGAPVEATVFDSERAADAFQVPTGIYTKTGKSIRPTQRLQRANVVVYVIRTGDYRRKTEEALDSLG